MENERYIFLEQFKNELIKISNEIANRNKDNQWSASLVRRVKNIDIKESEICRDKRVFYRFMDQYDEIFDFVEEAFSEYDLNEFGKLYFTIAEKIPKTYRHKLKNTVKLISSVNDILLNGNFILNFNRDIHSVDFVSRYLRLSAYRQVGRSSFQKKIEFIISSNLFSINEKIDILKSMKYYADKNEIKKIIFKLNVDESYNLDNFASIVHKNAIMDIKQNLIDALVDFIKSEVKASTEDVRLAAVYNKDGSYIQDINYGSDILIRNKISFNMSHLRDKPISNDPCLKLLEISRFNTVVLSYIPSDEVIAELVNNNASIIMYHNNEVFTIG